MHLETEITEEKAFEQDVTTMSYEELMASIRYLDAERKRLADTIHGMADNDTDHVEEEFIKRAA